MSRFISLLFILANINAIGQTNELAILAKTTSTYGITTGNFADTSQIKPAATLNARSAIVIIPSKMICRQRINSFLIAAADTNTSGTLIDLPAITAEGPAITPTKQVTGAKNNFIVEGITGAGSDVLELLLKTPGRVVNNPDINSLTNTNH